MSDLRTKTRKIQRLVGAKADGRYGPNTAARILETLESRNIDNSDQEDPLLEHEIDARTLKNVRTLEPKAQKKFVPFIRQAKAIAASMGCDYVAISGTRGEKEQNELFAKGRTKPGRKVTNARYGYSNHNFGIALDFGVFRGNKYLDSSDPSKAAAVHKAVAALAAEYGIDWGGNWRSFKDIPHFEIKTSLTTAQKRRKLLSGQSIL